MKITTNLLGRKATGPLLPNHHESVRYNEQHGEIVAAWTEIGTDGETVLMLTLLYRDGTTQTWPSKYVRIDSKEG